MCIRDRRNVGQQVVGDALGILADQAALVRADGVEIAQQHNVPFVVAHVQVGQHLSLIHIYRSAVSRGVRDVRCLLWQTCSESMRRPYGVKKLSNEP